MTATKTEVLLCSSQAREAVETWQNVLFLLRQWHAHVVFDANERPGHNLPRTLPSAILGHPGKTLEDSGRSAMVAWNTHDLLLTRAPSDLERTEARSWRQAWKSGTGKAQVLKMEPEQRSLEWSLSRLHPFSLEVSRTIWNLKHASEARKSSSSWIVLGFHARWSDLAADSWKGHPQRSTATLWFGLVVSNLRTPEPVDGLSHYW